MNDLQQLFPITAESFAAPSVDARKLHEWLGVGRDFTNWMKSRIEKYGFLPGRDFDILLANIGEQDHGGSNRTDYLLTVNMARELAMVETNDKGREVRKYFIDCEAMLHGRGFAAMPPTTIAKTAVIDMLAIAKLCEVPPSYAMQEAAKIASQQSGIDLTPLLNQSKAMQNVPQADVMLEPTELGKLFDTSAVAMNRKLRELGLQTNVAGQWTPTEAGNLLCEQHAWTRLHKSGYNLKWRAAEIEKLMGEAQ